ncbi:Glutaminase kidney isoform, mitochondrial [Anabarilius grahami]|uniref:glutaminase n=1 Tax=Anabarilius grahami TaxID=495550 RepID=A0A3N0YW40_ANAGA|nr:Glutaminase kidney isoform, mitochondrial [Anabarilius grahami]
MLQFRASIVLKELIQTSPKRSFSDIIRHKKTLSNAYCFSAAYRDGRISKLKINGRPFIQPLAGRRFLCTKTDGAIEPTEQVKKDETVQEATADNCCDSHLKQVVSRTKDTVVAVTDYLNLAGLVSRVSNPMTLVVTTQSVIRSVYTSHLVSALKATGLRTGDPRLKECMDMLKVTLKSTTDGVMLDRHLFKKCVQSNIVLLTQAFRKKFVIPDFQTFASHIDTLYEKGRKLSGGLVADYIPQLAKFSPDLWAVSLCTVDGQRHTVGDTKVPFCLQSCVKPLKYAIAVHDHGTEYVHQFIGKEPSGLRFNKLFLDEDDKPHNPMVNAGAIVCTSLIKHGAGNAEKFDYVMNFLKKMAGNEYVGFSNATFQSERESGDRNFAIGYYLKEKKCFPDGTDMTAVLDLYFQLCSIEVTCESASVMAATLANGGFCPITGERVLSPESVRNTLSLMHSCGMYDFSGQFAFHVGLPAKSGVAGGILLVVPNVMGIMCWSPPLDKLGNSVRGIQFCTDLVSLFNFHNYDNLRHFAKKLDPRREGGDQRPQTFGPLDYESLQKELALKDTVWTKVSPTECNEDSSTTVVYRMENVGDGN